MALAKKEINEGVTVQVNTKKEPDNPVDSKAMTFAFDVIGMWERIGYAVQEVLDEVHKVMYDSIILKMDFH